MEEKYIWDISLLQEMKQNLLQNKALIKLERKQDIQRIDFLISLVENKNSTNIILEIFKLIYQTIDCTKENILYLLTNTNKQQFDYFQLLKKTMEENPLPIKKVETTSFSIEDILKLFEEFLKWFPSKELQPFLETYYYRCFKTHFYYCLNQNLTGYGVLYSFIHFSIPFIAIEKSTFVETFITLVHEMGHVLFHLLETKYKKNTAKKLFFEMEGRYFEYLAHQFLIEKGYKEETIESICNSYSQIGIYLKGLEKSQWIRNIVSSELLKEIMTEVYSYLGVIELSSRYQGDYEKQLYDLVLILSSENTSLSQFLEASHFTWREDEFQKVKDYRNHIYENTKKENKHTL